MKTITFYSYKGGVGRSLALSNIAIKLSQLKKKVFVIDFDLDAPGLQFKFDNDYKLNKNVSRKGLVDYIYSFANENKIPEKLNDYVDVLDAKNVNDNNIDFLSAGDFEKDDYWKKLATTKWSSLFYSSNSYGIRFFLDLKAKIEKEFNPDYLLIDSRTGITDISGITLKIFADEIVILAVNNSENIFGTKKIISSLTKSDRELLNHSPEIHVILTRLPFPEEAEDKSKEFNILKRWENELNINQLKISEISVIHTDKQIHNKEIVKIGLTGNINTITYDYLKLFEKLFKNESFNMIDDDFEKIKRAEYLFNKAISEIDSLKKLKLLDQIIELNPTRYEYINERAQLYYLTKNKDNAISDFIKALEIKPNDPTSLLYLGSLYYDTKNYDEALNQLGKIEIDFEWKFLIQGLSWLRLGDNKKAKEILNMGLVIFPNSTVLLNSLADLLRKNKQLNPALNTIYKAIQVDPDYGLLFATLAEIKLDLGSIEDFYLNLNLALSKNVTATELNSAKSVYEAVKKDSRFLELLEKYQIKFEEVFK